MTAPAGRGVSPSRCPGSRPGGYVLVVGYGNPLRTDDGLGWQAATELADADGLPGARVLRCHQLAPELAVDVLRAQAVVLVDARPDDGGPITSRRVTAGTPGVGPWSHHVTPESLLGWAQLLGERRRRPSSSRHRLRRSRCPTRSPPRALLSCPTSSSGCVRP